MKKILILFFIISSFVSASYAVNIDLSNPFGKKDYKSQEIKYQYNVLKEDLENKKEGKILNRHPSGYMTVEEYEKMSEFKDKTQMEFDIPKIERPSDFKYIPQPLYKIVKYNDPPGKAELKLGRRLFIKRQVNGQGIVSPDYTKMVYSAVYYYNDSGSVAADMFVIPLNENLSNLTRILKTNTAQRNPEPILSTDKAIDNYAAFRTLTPIDFNTDGTKLLAKEKLGSSEDGIWETRIYVYDFNQKKSFDLNKVREAIKYYWKEYMDLELIAKRWDIIPLGFDSVNPDTVIVQGYAYTGEKPVYLGTWSINTDGEGTKLVSFDREYSPSISSNGFKIVEDGVKEYQTVIREEKALEKEGKFIEKQKVKADKKVVKQINEDYKYELKNLRADYKDKARDNRKLQTFAGSTEGTELEEMYHQYQQVQTQKDIQKLEKKIQAKDKQIEKIDQKIQKVTDETKKLLPNYSLEGEVSNTENSESANVQSEENNQVTEPDSQNTPNNSDIDATLEDEELESTEESEEVEEGTSEE